MHCSTPSVQFINTSKEIYIIEYKTKGGPEEKSKRPNQPLPVVLKSTICRSKMFDEYAR